MFAGIGAGRHADEAQRAGLGGDDGEADRPPRHRTAGQEVVAGGLLEPREPRTEGGDGEQVGGNDCVVDPGEDHAEGVSDCSVPPDRCQRAAPAPRRALRRTPRRPPARRIDKNLLRRAPVPGIDSPSSDATALADPSARFVGSVRTGRHGLAAVVSAFRLSAFPRELVSEGRHVNPNGNFKVAGPLRRSATASPTRIMTTKSSSPWRPFTRADARASSTSITTAASAEKSCATMGLLVDEIAVGLNRPRDF